MPIVIDLLAGVLASGISVLVGKFWGSARPRVPRWLGSVKLTYLRSTAAGVLGISLSAGVGLSTSDHTHRMMSYFLWYGIAAIALLVVIATTVVIDRQVRQDRPAGASKSRRMSVPPPPHLPLARERPQVDAEGKTRQIRRNAADKALKASDREAAQRERIKREVKEELGGVAQIESPRSVSVELRDWLARERERGEEFAVSARSEREYLAGAVPPIVALKRMGITSRDRLADLTRKASEWSARIRRQLADEMPGSVAAFEGAPLPAQQDPTQGDFTRLARYIDDRVNALTRIIGAADGQNDYLTQG